MTPKKMFKLILLNSLIIMANIGVFSKAFLGLSLSTGTALSMTSAWFTIIASLFSFTYFNRKLLVSYNAYSLADKNVASLDDCVGVFEEAIDHGDVFDENILKNLEQLKRFKRKRDTIRKIILQRFSPEELTYQKFESVLDGVENIMYLNMRSILNKIAAFDVEEYEELQRKGFPKDKVSGEKMKIYNEFLSFVENATETNEDILLKLDKMLLEVSKYNSLEDGDVKKLPAIVEIDELIKNAKLYG